MRCVAFALCVLFFASAKAGVRDLVFGSACVDVPSNLCALAYDDKDCRGWKLEIPVGSINMNWWNPMLFRYRNDIESVQVRAGCTLTGYDDSGFSGQSVSIRAGNRQRTVNLDDEDEYEDMDEEIESIECRCR